ncbi:WXG100 family type VII secretion target [Streptomyces sp. ITFR-16]|uniref:WXG100 family type VII secretion target n=1 Tax=Streptomyces sp. ITFR-16 TaxID=3075198 RepID=UPI00288B303F|nr:WXG100 family type VII secretion target [Streptomyces sp. ITFR-16]WNI22109.1 WXG100 family type VII secretion target [Streptomyces sp. ITFR-16]
MGHDPHTKVRYESVQEVANRIRAVSQNICRDLEEMDTALKVVTDTWDGEAYSEYVTLQSRYRTKADHMKGRLAHVAHIIETGKDHYRATDLRASRLFTEAY